jgi:hypothetical protein
MTINAIDRAKARTLVEEMNREMALCTVQHAETPLTEYRYLMGNIEARYLQKLDVLCTPMSVDRAEEFRHMYAEECEMTTAECKRGNVAFYRRLGVLPNSAPAPRHYHRQGLGELAVRTAVRATVWDLIFRLFRR